MTDAEVQDEILRAMLEQFYEGDDYGDLNLRPWSEARGVPWDDVCRNVDRLKARRLVDWVSNQSAELTAEGVVAAENSELIDPKISARERLARRALIVGMGGVQADGVTTFVNMREVAGRLDLDDRGFSRVLNFCLKAGSVRCETISNHIGSLTELGLELAHEWRLQEEVCSEFSALRSGAEVTPQARGHRLEALLERVLSAAGWECERNVRAAGEETDLVIQRGRDYYLVGCKWESAPIEDGPLATFRERLNMRPPVVQGAYFSMSPYTAGAIENTRESLQRRTAALFGPQDTEAVMCGPRSFDELLKEKVSAAFSRRVILWK